jgi:hypothetical protein
MNKLIIILSAVVFFASCKKNDTAPQPEPIGDRIKSISITTQNVSGSGTYSYTYGYDDKGRVTYSRITHTGDSTSYTYSGNTITERLFSGGVVVGTGTIELNSAGQVRQSTTVSGVQNAYSYNSDGYLSSGSFVFSSGTSTNTYYYSATKLLDSIVYMYNIAGVISKQTYIYDQYMTGNRKTNGVKNFGETWWGKDAEVPYQRRTRIVDGGTPEITTYSYEFDAKGRISKQVSLQPGPLTVTTTYTYL